MFPRTSVWIRHEASKAFVADPNVVTIYNRGQRYERRPISPDGDRCDWFAVSDELARDIAAAWEPGIVDSDRPAFRWEHAPSAPDLYLEQRRLAERAMRGTMDGLELEEHVIRVVSRVIELAYARVSKPIARRAAAARRRRDLAERAKAELLRTMTVNRSVSEIAATLETSTFHLCRVFRAHTGRTMYDYRAEVRMRAALDLLAASGGTATLSVVAHEVGFASHSHLVRVCRRYLGESPRAIRESLRGSIPV